MEKDKSNCRYRRCPNSWPPTQLCKRCCFRRCKPSHNWSVARPYRQRHHAALCSFAWPSQYPAWPQPPLRYACRVGPLREAVPMDNPTQHQNGALLNRHMVHFCSGVDKGAFYLTAITP